MLVNCIYFQNNSKMYKGINGGFLEIQNIFIALPHV